MADERELQEDVNEVMKEIFHSIDKDGSGKLDLGELRHAFHCIGIYYTDDEIADIIAEVDTDGDRSTLDFEEFKEVTRKEILKAKETQRKKFEEAFDVFDRDGNGKIDAKELRRILMEHGKEPLTEEDCEELIAEFNVDEDNCLSRQEYTDFFCEYLERWFTPEECQDENEGDS